ncbi:MAG: hypothetical protein LBN29_08280 [Mediterranea sp.]|jgi:undecaprenyl pyrophosphate phosphatase UppP|nr:hypothetical protein [Mediterranea sp.]
MQRIILIIYAFIGVIGGILAISGLLEDCGNWINSFLFINSGSSVSVLISSYFHKDGANEKKIWLKIICLLLGSIVFSLIVYGIENLLDFSVDVKVWSVVAVLFIGGLVALYIAIKGNKQAKARSIENG